MSGMRDVMKQQGSLNALLTKCQHAHSVSPLPLSFLPFVFRFASSLLQLCLAPREKEVFSWSEVFCLLSL